MNKQYLQYFAALLLAFLSIAPYVVEGDVSQDIHQNTYENISVNNTKMMLENASVSGEYIFLLDVRTPAEYNYSHIEGAKLIPLKNVPLHDTVNLSDDQLLPNRMKDLPEDNYTKIIVYCFTGKRGAIASQMIADAGYQRVYNMQGGITAWVNESYPVVMNPNSWANNYPKVMTT